MKRFLLTILLVILASPAFANFIDKQDCTNTTQFDGTAETSVGCVFSNPVTNGDTVVIFCEGGNNPTISATDNKSDAFTLAPNTNQYAGSGNESAAIFYSAGITSGAQTMTCDFNSAIYTAIIAHEYSGISTTNPVDNSAGDTGAGSAGTPTAQVPASSSLSLSKSAGDLIYVGFTDSNNLFTSTAGTTSLNYTLLTDNGATAQQADEYAISTTNTVVGSMTDSNGAGTIYTLGLVAFEPGPSSAVTTTVKSGTNTITVTQGNNKMLFQ